MIVVQAFAGRLPNEKDLTRSRLSVDLVSEAKIVFGDQPDMGGR
jgi:hypothetical protein